MGKYRPCVLQVPKTTLRLGVSLEGLTGLRGAVIFTITIFFKAEGNRLQSAKGKGA